MEKMNEILYFFEERNLLCTMSMSICIWITVCVFYCSMFFLFWMQGCKGKGTTCALHSTLYNMGSALALYGI